jgi:hypothetical protein
MIHASTDTQIKKAAAERAEVREVLSAGEEECVYCISIPIVVVGWVLLIIYVIL